MERLIDAAFGMVPQRVVAWLLALVAVVCGVLGIIAGWGDRALKLGELGWFTGGTAVAALAVMVMLDGLLARQRG